MKSTLVVFSALSALNLALKTCPGLDAGTPQSQEDTTIPSVDDYTTAVADLDIEAVFQDLHDLMTDSQECWPADIFPLSGKQHYGGLFIRLAWHCAGTYREHDGVGGCAGGRQRFPPEAHWEDNTNLDKARALLAPIKEEYGDALSWGDLFAFAGTAAIQSMGGPVTQVCAGRIDDTDGTKSLPLTDPNMTCPEEMKGNCELPLGAVQVGLIYVNPQGVDGDMNTSRSALRIRDVFGRMGMNDRETVALIGGGHALGKAHGACPQGAGKGPDEEPTMPWLSPCGENNITTSGLEGFWTETPFDWSNLYFQYLVDDSYVEDWSPTGAGQWKNERNNLMMLTTDLALRDDPIYKPIVMEFAADIEKLNTAFGDVWEKLMTNGGTWSTAKHCIMGSDIDLTMAPSMSPTASPVGDGASAAPTGSPVESSAIVHCVSFFAFVFVLFI